jgi:hypothetical protein
MTNSNISLFFILSYIITSFFVQSCANPQPPSGGPQDTIPPVIIEAYPENQTVNFEKRVILLRFCKYMEKSKVIENFVISPNIPVTFDWSGKVLEIGLPQDLDTTVTYSVSFGTEYTDIYNNKPAIAFSLIFSAGSKIDSGYISGKVYDSKPAGAYIYAFNIEKANPDTINPSNTKPDYKVQLGTNGEFRIPALKDAGYRIFSIRDQFKNELYEPVDDYASATHDIKVIGSKSTPSVLKLGPPVDKTGPVLNEVEPVFGNYLNLKFSEPVNSDFIFPESFELLCDDKSKTANIKSASIHYENKSRVVIITDKSLDSAYIWTLNCRLNPDIAVRDTLNNIVNDSLNSGKFKPVSAVDTAVVQFLYPSVKDSSEFLPVNQIFELIFDKSIVTNHSLININLFNEDDSLSVPAEIKIKGSSIFVKPVLPLTDKKWYRIVTEIKNLGTFANSKTIDTSFVIHFKTEDFKIKGSISGVVQYEKEICDFNKYIILKHTNGRYVYWVQLDELSAWSFNNIEPGDYSAEIFCDVDGNGHYSYGNPFPYVFSEPFVMFDDVLKVKPRWVLENIILKVKSIDGN